MPRTKLLTLAIVLLAAFVSSKAADAQTAADDRALAEALFRQGRELLLQGEAVAACPKLFESQRLDPALGTLLNLALCHEMRGQLASAWLAFTEAAAEAQQSGQHRRHRYARERARRIEPKLALVSVQISAPPEGLDVRLDRTEIAREAWGKPLPIDPGEHTLRAYAPGRREWATTFRIAGAGARTTIQIPPLQEVVPLASSTSLPCPAPPRPTPLAPPTLGPRQAKPCPARLP